MRASEVDIESESEGEGESESESEKERENVLNVPIRLWWDLCFLEVPFFAFHFFL